MAIDIEANTPAANALQNAVQQKLVEMDWSTGLDDSALAEYIILMVANGKDQEQITSELSNDLLSLGPDDPGATEFVRWLFQQAEAITGQSAQAVDPSQEAPSSGDAQMGGDSMADADMNEAQSDNSIPTGPKSMRNGGQKPRDKRIIGQVNKAMDRTGDAALHRVRGAAGAGRINSHSSAGAPRGPAPKGPRNQMARNFTPQQQNQLSNMAMNPAAAPFAGMDMSQMNPEQQAAMMNSMIQQQAQITQMMTQWMSPEQQQMMNMMPQGGMPRQPQGRSLFDRIQKGPRENGRKQRGPASKANDSDAMDLTSGLEGDSDAQAGPPADPAKTMCRFNTRCTKSDCQFAHQSPAAPLHTSVDMEVECTYGAHCQNRKCVGRHPSPAKKAEQQCRFWPNCTNPVCPYTHPNVQPCRNGADCKEEGCTFYHNPTPCKFNPCTNPACPFKHNEGQKVVGKGGHRVWINPEAEDGAGDVNKDKTHVSERKFVNESADEELILPGKNGQDETQPAEGIAA